MDIKDLRKLYSGHSKVKALANAISNNSIRSIYVKGLKASATGMVMSVVSEKKNMLFVLNDMEEAGYFYHDLTQLASDGNIYFFPSSYKRALKYGIKDPANEILRTEVLSKIQNQEEKICIVTYPEAIAEKVISTSELSDNTIQLKTNDTYDIVELAKRLMDIGFRRVDYVYEPGQYALRGSIIDVFSFSCEYPYRIDFWDDEIESIRTFDVVNQLSKEKLSSVTLVPEFANVSKSNISFLDFIPDDTIVAIKDRMWITGRIKTISSEPFTKQAIEAEPELEKLKLSDLVISETEFVEKNRKFKYMEFGNKPAELCDATIEFDTAPQPLFHKNFDLLGKVLNEQQEAGYRIYIASDSPKQIERIKAIFEDRNDNIKFEETIHTLHEGFIDNDIHICLFTDHQIFDRFHKYNLKNEKARSGKIAQSLKELNTFQVGDYVVHADHGIGRFAGLVVLPNGDKTQEVMKLVYQNDDVVFVSIHSLHKVSKYKGKDGEPPRINKLGTGAWEKLKEKTKSKIKDIARDLIRLYSQRKQEKGYAFSPDSFLQHELEASFIYEDTPDQFKCTQDVKRDMEKDTPMDRLICGDVGFGKTEIAIRAAFKAVSDNKQVAVLVPTTVLAYQHYQTFKSRLKDFPCKIEYLSRAKKASEVSRITKELASGETNILIGTHKIIGKSIKFHDLGLLIIDEEQKFGVSVKEKLRQMKVNVDTLTMTATPIPRTLQFSLMGARDLSVITTPPPNRYPIQTEVHTFDNDIIADAVNFEMGRNGQVFFVNNRINNLPELKHLLETIVPGVRVCIAHGQMEPAELEKIILDFINFEYDVMLSTSIIEAGIDIPNVNTIIINQAQNFGLSDLHQLRGRVGRSNRKSFCYLLAPPLSVLTPEAKRRLQAIENFSDLGSGIHIAMQDLDIRGAGNLLGAEQSGFIADLGYETYQRILNEAVQELKADEFADLYEEKQEITGEHIVGDEFVKETTIDCDLEAFFPNEYVPNSSERMLLYRELDKMTTDEQVEKFKSELIDRFGPIPPVGEELISIVKLRRLSSKLGIEKLVLKNGVMILYFVNDSDSRYFQSEAFGKILNFFYHNTRICELRENNKKSIKIKKVTSIQKATSVLLEIFALEPMGK